MNLIDKLEEYIPFNEQEKRDKEIILKHLKENPKIFSRESSYGHMTASSWIVNKNCDKVLMAYHNIYDSWSWLGGHADDDCELMQVALKEAMEESGLEKVSPLSEDIFSVEVLTVDGHEKRGRYVSSHLHFNITYLLQADDSHSLKVQPNENSGVSWFPINESVSMSSEPWFQKRIYTKLNEKLCLWLENK